MDFSGNAGACKAHHIYAKKPYFIGFINFPLFIKFSRLKAFYFRAYYLLHVGGVTRVFGMYFA